MGWRASVVGVCAVVCGCAPPMVDTSLQLVVPLGYDACIDQPLNMVVVDLFEYEGDRTARSRLSSACARCAVGEGGTCRRVARTCRCGPITDTESLMNVFEGTRFDDLSDESTYCVRLVVLSSSTSDCAAAPECALGAPLEGATMCGLSALGQVGLDQTPIDVNQFSCLRLDDAVLQCRGDGCECTRDSVADCPAGPRCDPECFDSLQNGCAAGAQLCESVSQRLLTTSECASFVGEP